MEKINRAQAFANQEKAASYMLAKKTLELNPHHPVIKEMLQRVKDAQSSGSEVAEEVGEYGTLLYNMALLNSGFLIENPTDFVSPLQKLLKLGFGLQRDAPIEEIEVEINEEVAKEEEEVPIEEEDIPGEVEVEEVNKQENNEDLREEL